MTISFASFLNLIHIRKGLIVKGFPQKFPQKWPTIREPVFGAAKNLEATIFLQAGQALILQVQHSFKL